MSSPPGLTRQALESVFTPTQLITLPTDRLDTVRDPDAREVLGTLGIPVAVNPFGMGTGLADRFERVGDWDWELADRYDDVPPGADRWIALGMIPYDAMALDPDTGRVYCLPQDAEIYLFNASLRAFVHFLYVLQSERPHFDVEWEGDDPYDPEGARARVEAAMRSVDPVALANPESRWFDVLASIVDPNHEYY